MKKQLFNLLLLSVIFIFSTGMKPKEDKQFVNFDKNLSVSKFEITNGEYRLFLNEMKSLNETEKYKTLIPDSTLWLKLYDYSYNDVYSTKYNSHASFNNYPVVNLKKEAIEAYCKWLTTNYNSTINKEHKKVVFRLPTEKEWKLFSSPLPDHKLPWYGNYPYITDNNNNVIPMANVKVKNYATDKNDYVQDGAFTTSKVGQYKPNSIGIYDIIGNVAELTSDGKIKGGSWSNSLAECMIDKTQDYQVQDPRVGFRVVMEIIE